MKTVIFVKKKNITLRNHRPGATDQGNFNVLVNFWVDVGDVVLETHLVIQTKNVSKIKRNGKPAIIRKTSKGCPKCQMRLYSTSETEATVKPCLYYQKAEDPRNSRSISCVTLESHALRLVFRKLHGHACDGPVNMAGETKADQ